MKKVLVIISMGFLLLSTSCTQQSRAKRWGGSYTVDLPKDRKLVEVTWKDSQLWVLTRVRKENESVDNYTFQENSSWGMLEGVVTLKEY